MSPVLGRAIAAVGVVTGFLGVWVGAIRLGEGGSISYWDLDRTHGSFLLALTCLSAVLLVASAVTGLPALDPALAVAGAVAWGSFVLFPAIYAGDRFHAVAAGGWLGACTALVPLGAFAAYVAARGPVLRDRAIPQPAAFPPGAIAVIGGALVLAGLWLRVERGQGSSYWNLPGSGHSLGVLFLLLLGLAGVSLAAGLMGRPLALLVAAVVAPALLGLTLTFPVLSAFGELDRLRSGAWLTLAGGILLTGGTLLAWHRTIVSRLRGQSSGSATPVSP